MRRQLFTNRDQRGVTLIELLSALGLVAIMLTLAVPALRNFWYVRALDAGENDVISQLRAVQQRVIAESFPLVYGARFPKGGKKTEWGLVRYDPKVMTNPDDDVCTEIEKRSFTSGVEVKPSSSVTPPDGTTFVMDSTTLPLEDKCRKQIRGGNNDYFVFFFPRGNATEGQVVLVQKLLDNRTRKICVNGPTGRIYAEKVSVACD